MNNQLIKLIYLLLGAPPPVLLHLVALPRHDDLLADVEAELVRVLGAPVEDGEDLPAGGDAQLLLREGDSIDI